MSAMASQITGLSIVYSTICSSADQRKHQSLASLAFVMRIHRWPVNSPHKGPVARKMLPFDDVIMIPQKVVAMNFVFRGTLTIPKFKYLPVIDQSHRYGRHQAACRKPAGSYDKTTRTAICFEHKTQYLLIRAPYSVACQSYANAMIILHVENLTSQVTKLLPFVYQILTVNRCRSYWMFTCPSLIVHVNKRNSL